MYPQDLIKYYNIKYGYNIKLDMRMRFANKSSNAFFEVGKGRNAILTMPELPKLGKPFVKREGDEDPNWDFDSFITEAYQYYQQNPEEQPSSHRETK